MNTKVVIAGTGLGCFSAGLAVGYFGFSSKIAKKYEALYTKEINDSKVVEYCVNDVEALVSLYERESKKTFGKETEYATVDEAVEALIGTEEAIFDSIVTYNPNALAVDLAEEQIRNGTASALKLVDLNAFDSSKYNREDEMDIENRDPESPYIISADEFNANEGDFEQRSLTYYEDDDVLADEKDLIIEEVEAVVGVDNLTKFGVGSGNKDLLFIRNERLECDFDVSRHESSYSKVVLGFVEEPIVQKRRNRKRGDDE